MLTAAQVEVYQRSRRKDADASVLCHAPFVALNFDQSGAVSVCCYNRRQTLGTYPAQSLDEIWRGAPLAELRRQFLDARDAPGCELCFHQIAEGAGANALARNFDRFADGPGYRPAVEMPAPRVLEFELSNACNLECVMCSGHWSSRIRAHREKLPPLANPYDDAFVEQLTPFLRSVRMAKFLGGEPFLVRRYYQIWERLCELNPTARLGITTNATLLPERAKAVLEALDTHVTVSLDAVTKPTFESIRRNADFDTVMRNVEYLHRYTLRRETGLSLTACPMTYNWRELPQILAFAQQREHTTLFFNTVLRPSEASLASLGSDELGEIAAFLAQHQPAEGDDPWSRENRASWDGLVQQLEGWQRLRRRVEQHQQQLPGSPRSWIWIRSLPLSGECVRATERMSRRLALLDATAELRESPDLGTVFVGSERQTAQDLSAPDLLSALHLAQHVARAGDASPLDEARLAGELAFLRREWSRFQQGYLHWTHDVGDYLDRDCYASALGELRLLLAPWEDTRAALARPSALFEDARRLLAERPRLAALASSPATLEDVLLVVCLIRDPERSWTLPSWPAHVFPLGQASAFDILAASHLVDTVLERRTASPAPPLDEWRLRIELRALARRLRIWRTKHGENYPAFEANLLDHIERGDAGWCAEQAAKLLAGRRLTWDELLYRVFHRAPDARC